MPDPGFFVLHPAVLPPLTADRYTLHGEIEDMPHGPIDPAEAQLVVSSPRFTMPPEQILSTFPPANHAGSFQDTLPQVVLKRRTLPWERRLDPADEHLPWLALVVIAEGEGSLSSESKVEDCVTPGTVLPDPEDRDTATSVYLTVTQTVVNGVFPTKDDVRLLAHVREVDVHDSELMMAGDDDGFVAVVIANRLPQPAFDDQGNPVPKKYLACLVNLEGQAGVLPPPVPDHAELKFDFLATDVVQDLTLVNGSLVDHPDRFVMGPPHSAPQAPGAAGSPAATRPDTATAAVRTGSAWATKDAAAIDAAAVSATAEQAPTLVRDAMAGRWQLPIFVAEPTYRFPVLAHWSFTVSGDPTFEGLMKSLDVGLIGTLVGDLPPKTPQEIERARHRAPPPAPARPAPELAETGHVGLGHQTRRGDHVRAWFRGPASAHPTIRDQAVDGRLPLAHTSDQLRIVVPDGREDVSLAAAFEIGRMLALSRPAIVNALVRWRQEQFGAQRAAQLVAEARIKLLDGLLDQRRPNLGALLGRRFVLAAARQPDKVLAPSRPLVDPGSPLSYATGDLNGLIAEGLGFSLEEVTKASQGVGVVAALADAPVAFTDRREAVLQGPAFAALQSDLDLAVTSLAADVLKQAPAPSSGPAAAIASELRATNDALDQLLDPKETQ